MAEATQHEIVEHAHDDHAHSDTVVILGREITIEGGIYTVIFFGLGILTVLEVLIAQVLESAIVGNADASGLIALKAFLLLGLGIIKSALVILFYMHLKHENRLLAVVLLLPLIIAALSVIFVLSVPPTGYTL